MTIAGSLRSSSASMVYWGLRNAAKYSYGCGDFAIEPDAPTTTPNPYFSIYSLTMESATILTQDVLMPGASHG